MDQAIYVGGARRPCMDLSDELATLREEGAPGDFLWVGLKDPTQAEFDEVNDELGLHYLHRPFTGTDDLGLWLKAFYTELNGLLDASTKVIAHSESVDDRIIGIMGGYIRWSGMVDDPSLAINLTERIAKRQLDPFAREVILMAHELR